MSGLWGVRFLECPVFRVSGPWAVRSLACSVLRMFGPWGARSLGYYGYEQLNNSGSVNNNENG